MLIERALAGERDAREQARRDAARRRAGSRRSAASWRNEVRKPRSALLDPASRAADGSRSRPSE